MIEVLIVNDDEALHVELPRIFHGASVIFRHSFTFEDAVIKVSQFDFSLLITSFSIGNSSGIELVKICNEYRSSVKTVLMVSDAEFDLHNEEITELGLASIISQPPYPKELCDLFAELFSIYPVQHDSKKTSTPDFIQKNIGLTEHLAEPLSDQISESKANLALDEVQEDEDNLALDEVPENQNNLKSDIPPEFEEPSGIVEEINIVSEMDLNSELIAKSDSDSDFAEHLLYLDSLVTEMEFVSQQDDQDSIRDQLSDEIVIETIQQRKKRLEEYKIAATSDTKSSEEKLNPQEDFKINYSTTKRPEDPDLVIIVTPDELEARLILYPNEEIEHEVSDIKRELERAGVTFGIDHNRISELIDQVNLTKIPILGEVIAKGIPAIPGKDAEVVYEFFAEQQQLLIIEDEYGRVDYRDIYQLDSVREGDLLATIIPVEPPVEGTSVLGRELTGKLGMDTRVINGKNCFFDDGTLQFRAEITGQPLLKGNKIVVVPVYVVAGDVDLSVGNISFMGSVIVNGNVNAGFKVTAEEDIRVMGFVENALLKAGGQIAVKKGFIGGESGMLSSVGGITVKHCNNGIMKCDGDIIVEQYVINSDVNCKGKLISVTGKGCIIGGLNRAAKGVECLSIGSELGVHTTVIAGANNLVAEMLKKINLYLKLFRERINKISKAIEVYNRASSENPELVPKLKKLNSVLTLITQKEQLLINQKEALLKELNAKCHSKIKVKNTVFPNVKIQIGNSVLKIQDALIGCIFSEDSYKSIVRLDSYQ